MKLIIFNMKLIGFQNSSIKLSNNFQDQKPQIKLNFAESINGYFLTKIKASPYPLYLTNHEPPSKYQSLAAYSKNDQSKGLEYYHLYEKGNYFLYLSSTLNDRISTWLRELCSAKVPIQSIYMHANGRRIKTT